VTGVFDGLARVLNRTLGAPVTHTPDGGEAREIRAIFRQEPVGVPDDDGREILTFAPIISVQKAEAGDIARGDKITLADGREWRVVNSQINGSPAADAFTIFELEEWT
jgi:hypothetical protein